MDELRKSLENGDLSVAYDGLGDLHVYASTDVLRNHAYVGTELWDDDPTHLEVQNLLDIGQLVVAEDGVIVNVNGEDVYTQFLIETDQV